MDAAAVKAGVNAIAYPSESAVKVAERFRLDMVFVPVCCSYVYKEFR